eukprot:g31490.t1
MATGSPLDAVLVRCPSISLQSPRTLRQTPDIAKYFQLDGTITLVDCKTILDRLGECDADEQAQETAVGTSGHKILLNKLDLVNDHEVAEVWSRIRSYNETAPIVPSVKGIVPALELTNIGAYDLEKIEAEERADTGHGHSHGHGHEECHEDHGEGHGHGHGHEGGGAPASPSHCHGHSHSQHNPQIGSFSIVRAKMEEVEDLSPEARDRYISQDEDDGLDWSWRYVALCVLLPCLNGCANGFAWAAVGLYFRSMQWPLWHCGLAGASGFVLRWLCQQLQLRVGLWVTLPLSMCHLSAAILAIVYSDQEWAIMGQMICLHGFDPTMCIEGVVYDAFRCRGERISSQATSTALSIMALMAALASTAGGLIYDYFNWQGMAVFHTSTQSLILLILLIHPTCRRSFMEVFFRKKAKSSKKLRSRTEATENERGKQKEGLGEGLKGERLSP